MDPGMDAPQAQPSPDGNAEQPATATTGQIQPDLGSPRSSELSIDTGSWISGVPSSAAGSVISSTGFRDSEAVNIFNDSNVHSSPTPSSNSSSPEFLRLNSNSAVEAPAREDVEAVLPQAQSQPSLDTRVSPLPIPSNLQLPTPIYSAVPHDNVLARPGQRTRSPSPDSKADAVRESVDMMLSRLRLREAGPVPTADVQGPVSPELDPPSAISSDECDEEGFVPPSQPPPLPSADHYSCLPPTPPPHSSDSSTRSSASGSPTPRGLAVGIIPSSEEVARDLELYSQSFQFYYRKEDNDLHKPQAISLSRSGSMAREMPLTPSPAVSDISSQQAVQGSPRRPPWRNPTYGHSFGGSPTTTIPAYIPMDDGDVSLADFENDLNTERNTMLNACPGGVGAPDSPLLPRTHGKTLDTGIGRSDSLGSRRGRSSTPIPSKGILETKDESHCVSFAVASPSVESGYAQGESSLSGNVPRTPAIPTIDIQSPSIASAQGAGPSHIQHTQSPLAPGPSQRLSGIPAEVLRMGRADAANDRDFQGGEGQVIGGEAGPEATSGRGKETLGKQLYEYDPEHNTARRVRLHISRPSSAASAGTSSSGASSYFHIIGGNTLPFQPGAQFLHPAHSPASGPNLFPTSNSNHPVPLFGPNQIPFDPNVESHHNPYFPPSAELHGTPGHHTSTPHTGRLSTIHLSDSARPSPGMTPTWNLQTPRGLHSMLHSSSLQSRSSLSANHTGGPLGGGSQHQHHNGSMLSPQWQPPGLGSTLGAPTDPYAAGAGWNSMPLSQTPGGMLHSPIPGGTHGVQTQTTGSRTGPWPGIPMHPPPPPPNLGQATPNSLPPWSGTIYPQGLPSPWAPQSQLHASPMPMGHNAGLATPGTAPPMYSRLSGGWGQQTPAMGPPTANPQPNAHGRSTTLHNRWCYPDATVAFSVGSVEYRLHRYIFENASMTMKNMLATYPFFNPVPIQLLTVDKDDFEDLLEYLYNRDPTTPALTKVDEWVSLFRAATGLGMTELSKLAVKKVAALAKPVDLIGLGETYEMKEWTYAAYEEMCMNVDETPSVADAEKLGMETVLKIWQVQQQVLKMGLSRVRDRDVVERIITRKFELNSLTDSP